MTDRKRDVIECKPGDRIVYANPDNGYPSDRKYAAEHLVINQIYTVCMLDVGSYSSSVYIGEPVDKWFNTVMFEVAE